MNSSSVKKSLFYDTFHRSTSTTHKVIKKNNFTYWHIIRIINQHFNLKNNPLVLDYGSGSGALSTYMAKEGAKVIGFDVSNKAVETANKSSTQLKLGNKCIFVSKQKDIKGPFDYILCSEVIEHVENDKQLLRYFYKKLKREGKLILSTPSENAPMYRLGLTKKFDIRVGHLRRYSEKKLRENINDQGFEILELKKTESIIRNLLFTTPIGLVIKFIKGPLVGIINSFDQLTVSIFGESDLILVAQKP